MGSGTQETPSAEGREFGGPFRQARLRLRSRDLSGLIVTPGLLPHVVAIRVIVCAGAAAAADLLKLAHTASPFRFFEAESQENRAILPYPSKRRPPYVPGMHWEVGTRMHVPVGQDAAVRRAGKTSLIEAHVQTHLLRDAHELGRAHKGEGAVVPVLVARQPASSRGNQTCSGRERALYSRHDRIQRELLWVNS